MKDYEKAIDQAAKINAGLDKDLQIDYDERYYQSHKCNLYEKFINGAKSPEAKAFHQQGMYSEEEVINLIHSFGVKLAFKYHFQYMFKDDLGNVFKEWFDDNKKK